MYFINFVMRSYFICLKSILECFFLNKRFNWVCKFSLNYVDFCIGIKLDIFDGVYKIFWVGLIVFIWWVVRGNVFLIFFCGEDVDICWWFFFIWVFKIY